MSELELKFSVAPEVMDALRSALLERGAQPVLLRARYFDTVDGLLADHRMALRLRLEDDRWVQTLKTAGDGIVARFEHEVAVYGTAESVPALDLHRHDGTEAGAALSTALASAADPALVERYATDVHRLQVTLDGPEASRIELALDTGSVRAGDRMSPLCEMEFEHKSGPLPGLFKMAQDWVTGRVIGVPAGGLALSTVTKAERGERLLRKADTFVAIRAGKVALTGEPSAADLMRGLLQSSLYQVLCNASDVLEGSAAPETVHQLRVGLRRLRTVLRELQDLSPMIDAGWDAGLAQTFSALGELRDQTAVRHAVAPLLAAAGAPAVEWPSTSGTDPVEAVRDPAFQGALLAVLALAQTGDDHFATLAGSAARRLVRSKLSHLHRRIEHAARRFEKLPLEEQHGVRKRLKRLRYLTELTAFLWRGRARRRYLRLLSDAQDALGEHNDVSVSAAAHREQAASDASAWFGAGYLQGHLPLTAGKAGKRLRRLPPRLPLTAKRSR